MVTKGLLARFEAKEGKKDELESFLKSALPLARQEADTIAWFALHFGGRKYGIFDAFPDESGRQAHLRGSIAQALTAQGAALLAEPPTIDHLDIIASKLPSAPPAVPDTKALLLTFQPKSGHEERLHDFLVQAQHWVEEEPDTIAWFGIRLDDGKFGIFDTFPDHSGRLKHLTGRVARELATHALSLLGGLPDPDLLDALAEKL